MKKIIGISCALAFGLSTLNVKTAQAINPGKLDITVYGVYLMEDKYCTGSYQTIFEDAAGVTVNFLDAPFLGGSLMPDGEYNCVVIKMSDQIVFSSSGTDGNCTAGSEYTLDVCQAGSSTYDILGNSLPCTGNNDSTTSQIKDIAHLYVTTGSYSTGGNQIGNTFQPPTNSNDKHGIIFRGGPFVVKGGASGEFIVDATDKVVNNAGQGTCDMNVPKFGFRKKGS